jgi:hypothetical protein
MIQFAPANHEFRSQAIVNPDGTFLLRLLFGNEQLEGAIEGPHKVTIYFPPDKIPPGGSPSLQLPDPCLVRAESNHFSIKLPPLNK